MSKLKIFIVEDDSIIRMELQERLTDLGYEVAGTASTGRSAIEGILLSEPDLVLMDIRLEGDMDGVDTAEHIRNSHDIPVVYLTAYADDATLKRAKKTEPLGYILKPFDVKMLHTTIEMAMYRHRMEQRLKHNEQKYRNLFEGVPVGIYRSTCEGKVLDANRTMIKMLGYPDKKSLLNTNAVDLYADPEERKNWQGMVKKDGYVRGVEMRLRCRDGSIIWVRNNTHEVQNQVEGEIYYEGAIEDITDRKLAEEKLRTAHDQLEKRVEERTAELLVTNEKLNREIKERKQAVKALKKSEAELQLLSSKLIAVQEEERERIARELHDSVGQYLTFAKMNISGCLQKAVKSKSISVAESLKVVLPTIQEAIDEIRGICANLWPPMLNHLGIMKTLQWLCEDFQKCNAQVQMKIRLEIEEWQIPQRLKIVIYRIVQEALSNILKHSKADKIQVGLFARDGGVELTVCDNGNGFDPHQASLAKRSTGGIGLASMKKRTEHSGGTFDIQSSPDGSGCRIRASWPEAEQAKSG